MQTLSEILSNIEANNWLKVFLNEHSDLVKSNDFSALYDLAGVKYRRLLTALLFKSGIDPLDYISDVPSNFISHMVDEQLINIIIPNNVKRLSKYAFFNSCVQSISLPKTILMLSEGAFYQCMDLEKIMLPERLISIESDVFSGCGKLRELELPETLEFMSISSFPPNLKSLIIPERTYIVLDKLQRVTDKLDYPITYKGIEYRSYKNLINAIEKEQNK